MSFTVFNGRDSGTFERDSGALGGAETFEDVLEYMRRHWHFDQDGQRFGVLDNSTGEMRIYAVETAPKLRRVS